MSQFIQDTNKWMVGDSPVTLQPTGKYPVVANLQWNSFADLMEFVQDPESTAIVGMVVAVVNDEYYDRNGVYVIEGIGDDGKVSKLGEHIYTASNEEDEKYLGNGFEGVQSYWETVEIGDIPSGLHKDDELIYNQPVHRILDLLLYKTLQPEVTEPSIEIVPKPEEWEDYEDWEEGESGVILKEVSDKLPKKTYYDCLVDKGLVSYPYNEDLLEADPSEYYYAGEPTINWTIMGPDGNDYFWRQPMHYEGVYTITCSAEFAPGSDLWDNKRNPAKVDAYGGGTLEETITIHTVRPVYVNEGVNIDEFEGLLVDYFETEDGEVEFDVEIKPETEKYKLAIFIPNSVKLVSVHQYNTLSDTYNIPIKMVKRGDAPGEPHITLKGEYKAFVRTHDAKDIQGASKYRITIKRK